MIYRQKVDSLANISPAESVGVSSITFTQSVRKATKFGQITRRLGLLRRSRSSEVTEFGTNRKFICDFLLVINSNLAPILYRFRDIAFNRSKMAIFGYPTEWFPWDDLRKILPESQWVAKVPNGIETLPKSSIA